MLVFHGPEVKAVSTNSPGAQGESGAKRGRGVNAITAASRGGVGLARMRPYVPAIQTVAGSGT